VHEGVEEQRVGAAHQPHAMLVEQLEEGALAVP
jgi:hypothetical protein